MQIRYFSVQTHFSLDHQNRYGEHNLEAASKQLHANVIGQSLDYGLR